MKRLHVKALVLGVALLLVAAIVPAGPAGAQATGRLRISVYYEGRRLPGMGVIVNSSASDPRGWINTGMPNSTDGAGGYILDVPAGTYDVHVADGGVANVTHASQVQYEIPVRAGAVVDVIFDLATPVGMMQGQVARPDGSWVAGVKVEAFATWARGDRPPYGWGQTVTNEAGWFTIPNLVPNQYYVVFVPELGIRFDGVPIVANQVTGDVPLWTSGFYAGAGPRAA